MRHPVLRLALILPAVLLPAVLFPAVPFPVVRPPAAAWSVPAGLSVATGTVVVEITRRGGHCAGECANTVAIFSGRAVVKVNAESLGPARPGARPVPAGRLTTAELRRLNRWISSFDSRTLGPSTDCPPAYDGQERIYRLHRGKALIEIAECRNAVPATAMFAWLDARFDRAMLR